MSLPAYAVAHARSSCKRCHRRKKRCDRELPQCENCRQADVACSFLEDDTQTGSYAVSYVKGLEQKVRLLEQKLAALMNPAYHTVASGHDPYHPSQLSVEQQDLYFGSAGLSATHSATDLEWLSGNTMSLDVDAPLGSDPSVEGPSVAAPTAELSLEEELKHLSLEAIAERHLGHTSGVSFAKLAQAALRRLWPDNAGLIFREAQQVSSGQQQPHLDLPSFPGILDPFFGQFDNALNADSSPLVNTSPLCSTGEADLVQAAPGRLPLPEHSHAQQLVDYYFAHSHTLYPILSRTEFTAAFAEAHQQPEGLVAQSPLWLFKFWIVLAIGSTMYCSVSFVEESEPMLYYTEAMQYFEPALAYGDMAALEVIMLQVSYSFFNQLGPNIWLLVGLAARLAVGLGLQASTTYENMSPDQVERKKRIFFSIYMMDRVVSIALGRPFALHDSDIDATPFSDVDEEDFASSGRPQSKSGLKPSILAIPLHILSLRQIASNIAVKVYSKTPRLEDRDEIINALHKDLVDWRRSMPFPLPDLRRNVPHLSSSWYDFNFYTHLAMLYRPSPLSPTLDPPQLAILADAAAMSIRQAVSMHRQRGLAYNWLNLHSIFTVILSLIYAVSARPDSTAAMLRDTNAIHDLEMVLELFDALRVKFPSVDKLRGLVQSIIGGYKSLLADAP